MESAPVKSSTTGVPPPPLEAKRLAALVCDASQKVQSDLESLLKMIGEIDQFLEKRKEALYKKKQALHKVVVAGLEWLED